MAAPNGNADPRVDHLHGRVDTLESAVKSLAASMETGFVQTRTLIDKSHQQLSADIREITRTQVSSARPNYNAIGVAFAVVAALLGWYVAGVVNPITEQVKAEHDARRAADTTMSDQIAGVISRQIVNQERIARLEAMARNKTKD